MRTKSKTRERQRKDKTEFGFKDAGQEYATKIDGGQNQLLTSREVLNLFENKLNDELERRASDGALIKSKFLTAQ